MIGPEEALGLSFSLLHGGEYEAGRAWAAYAQAAAMLQPELDLDSIVGQAIEEAERDGRLMEGVASAKLAKVSAILDEAKSDGSRRHPAIYAALEVIRGRDRAPGP